MKKKTLLTLLAACLLTLGLGSCCIYDDYGYGYGYGHRGYYHHSPSYRSHHSYHRGHHYYHGPNAEMTPEAQVMSAE